MMWKIVRYEKEKADSDYRFDKADNIRLYVYAFQTLDG